MANDGISEKVLFLLELAKKGTASESELSKIIEMISAHSDNVTLGRVFGYSVSDYAIATLKWLDSENALSLSCSLSKGAIFCSNSLS